MICPRCSRQLPDGSKFCDGCGLALTNQAPTQAPTYQQPGPFPNAPQQYPYPQAPLVAPVAVPGKGLGIASLVLGILALIISCFPIIDLLFSVTGATLGIIGFSKAKKVGMSNGIAVAGLVCSIVALSINIVFTILFGIALIESIDGIDNFDELVEVMIYILEENY